MKLKVLLMPVVAVAGLVLSGCESLHYGHSSCSCDPCCCCSEADGDATNDGEKPAEPYDEPPKPNKTAPAPPREKQTADRTDGGLVEEVAEQIVKEAPERIAVEAPKRIVEDAVQQPVGKETYFEEE